MSDLTHWYSIVQSTCAIRRQHDSGVFHPTGLHFKLTSADAFVKGYSKQGWLVNHCNITSNVLTRLSPIDCFAIKRSWLIYKLPFDLSNIIFTFLSRLIHLHTRYSIFFFMNDLPFLSESQEARLPRRTWLSSLTSRQSYERRPSHLEIADVRHSAEFRVENIAEL